jgi:hypothetical protein
MSLTAMKHITRKLDTEERSYRKYLEPMEKRSYKSFPDQQTISEISGLSLTEFDLLMQMITASESGCFSKRIDRSHRSVGVYIL